LGYTVNVHMCEQIKDQLEFPSDRNQSLSPMNQLLVALRFYATGTFQLVVGDTFAINKSTVCRVLHHVTRSIASLRDKYVKFPMTQQQQHDTMKLFYSNSKLPGVVGAIDCTHVTIQSPGGDDAEIYRNRKGYFSLNVQLVCDSTSYITDIVCRWPGSVHDSTIFDNSHVHAMFESGQVEGCLVGDGGYACRRYMLTPVSNPQTASEVAYNNAQSKARNCIERTNGILKRRFPALKYCMRLRLDHSMAVIVATVVLHNIAMMIGDDELPVEDTELAAYVTTRHLEALNDAGPAQPPPTANRPGADAVRRAVIANYF